jgi:uncharacterized membrane protein YraQ (UPF0718 family)
MKFLYILTFGLVIISFIFDYKKTLRAFKLSFTRFINIVPTFVTVLVFVTIIFYLIPDKLIFQFLSNENKFISIFVASFLGCITMMPGFIAFPLCGFLLNKGVSYMVLSAFSSTLMTVGVLTYPLEKAYFGTKVTIIRNMLSFCISIVIAIVTGILYGEIF